MSYDTTTLQVEGNLTDITKDQLKLCFQNRRAQGGGPVDDIKIATDKKSAVIVFKETSAVDLIINRRKPVTIANISLQVSPFYDETSDESSDPQMDSIETTVPPEINSKIKMPAKNISAEVKLKSTIPSKKSNSLKVKGIPNVVTEESLAAIFKKERRDCVRSIEAINISEDRSSAIVVFKDTEAVDFILSKGNTVSHSGALLQMKRYYIKTKLTDAKYRYTDEAAVGPDLRNAQDKRKLKAENIAVESQNKNQRTKEKDEAYNFNTNQKEFQPTAKKVGKGKYPKDVLRSAKIDVHLDEEESDLSPYNCTVKIRVGSIKESKDVYIFYLEDPAVNTGEFIEDSLMLDGINKVVYVTFCSPQEARDFCELPHTESDMDILNVEMATEEDFLTYPNYIFLRGKLNGADELADFIHENFDLEILDILHEDDSDSYIVIFDPETCTDITPLTWELTSLSGNKMITAPVTIQNCVLLSGLTTSISSQTLQRYLENKRRSGGGKVKSLERISDEQAIICFEDEVDLDDLLSKDHKIENSELSLRRHFPCLSEKYMIKEDTENEMTTAEHTPSRSIHKEKNPGHHYKMNTTYSRLLKEDCVQQEKECNKLFLSGKSYGKTVSCGNISKLKTKEKKFQHKEEVPLERFEIKLLEKCKFFDQINDRHKEINLNLDYNANKVILNGEDKRQLEDIHCGILSKCRQDVDFSKLDNLTTDQITFLKKDNVQKKVDSMLDNSYMQCNENDVKLYYLKSESLNIKDAEKIIRSQAEVHTKPMNQDMLNMLQSSDGSRFMSSLIDDNSSFSTIIKLDSQSKTLSIIASEDQLYQVVQEIETYLKTNKLHKVEIHLSEGKHRFLKKFLMDDFSTFKSSIENDALIEFTSDRCVIRGVKDVVERCEGFIKNILAKIVGNNVMLKFFGIKEFLHDSEGKTLIKSIEEEHRCIILLKSEANKTCKPKVAVKTPTLIAKCSINGVNISFFQGNILELNADVLVNPLDPSQQFVSAMSKELIKLGGQNIKKDFKRSCTSSFVGSVTETSSGSLSNINSILHLVCPVYCDDQKVKELESTVRACLHYAANKNYSSISIPAVGLGKILKFSLTSVCKNMVNVVKDFIETGTNSFREIYFCDMKPASIRKMMESFENKFNDIQFETETMLADKRDFKFSSQSPHKSLSKKGWDFKSIKVNVALGEINKQDTDIIVITVDKSLDLTKGRLSKIILDEAGDRIQEELRNKYNNGIKAGDFAMSSGGNLPCQHIFYACLSRNRGDNGQMENLVYKLLEQAIKLQVTSISIPALGTGNLGYSSDNSAQVIIETIEKFASRNSSPDLKVNVVVLPKDQEIAQSFNKILSAEGRMATGEKGAHGKSGATGGRGATGGHNDKEKKTNSYKNFSGIIKYGSVSLKIKKGDITKERKTDVIVNGIKDSMDLSHSGKVCKILLNICGQELQDECLSKQNEMMSCGIVVTSAPKLQCKHIIHISQDQFSRYLDKGVTKVLLEAEKIGASTLSMPVLGAGAHHANVEGIKKSILGAIEQFGNSTSKKLTKIKLVIFDPNILSIFMSHLAANDHFSQSDSKAKGSHNDESKKVELKMYSDDESERSLAEKKLIRKCKSAYVEKKEKIDNLQRLTPQQIKDVVTLGLQSRIKVKIQEQELIMKGFKSEGLYKVLKQVNKLVFEAVQNHHRSLLQAIPSSIEWQYKQGDRWRNFDSTMNIEIEKASKTKASSFEMKDAKGRKIEIDFEGMKETFLDEHGRKSTFVIRRNDKSQSGEPLPKKWDKMGPTENLKIVEVHPKSPEYHKIEQFFTTKGANFPVKKIARIQNKTLYQQYYVKKRDIELNNPKGHQNEQRLFHGTASKPIPQINENGFNRSYCGVNGTVFGSGVYFADNSSYSETFAVPDFRGKRHMYVARVLTGENIMTDSSTLYLPKKPRSVRPYDSGGDPSQGIYVIFHDAQVYPEYLITF